MPNRRTVNSQAQLALPGFGATPRAPVFDLFGMIRATFRQWAPEGEMPGIQVSRRMIRTLGSFTPSKNVIRLSARLLALGSPEEQQHVALHEVAHAIVHQRSPKAQAHGREFRTACRELGLKPGRFVDIDRTAWRDRLRYVAECPSCGERVIRKKQAHRVKCECGASVRPSKWFAFGVTESGLKPL